MKDIILIYNNAIIEKDIIKKITNNYGVINIIKLRLIPFNKINNFLNKIYFFLCIKFNKPKIILTFIDNDGIFQSLIKYFPDTEFYAIQNGSRSMRELIRRHKNNLTNYFCFGNYEKDMFNKFGHKAKRFFPVGSLYSATYKSRQNKKNSCHSCFKVPKIRSSKSKITRTISISKKNKRIREG